MQKINASTIDEYIAFFPKVVQQKLNQLRNLVRKEAIEAKEKISYGIPTFDLHGNLVHFAAYQAHIGFYPGPAGIEAFARELAGYPTSKGTVQFALDKPLPVKLIRQIVQFRVAQNQERWSRKNLSKSNRKEKAATAKPKVDPTIQTVKTATGYSWMEELPAPAQRALAAAGITTLKKLSSFTAAGLLALHGFGPSSIPKVRELLAAKGWKLKGE